MGKVTVNEQRTEQLVGLIARAEAPPTTDQIAQAAGLSKQSANMYLAKLAGRGLVRRAPGSLPKKPLWEQAAYDNSLPGDLPPPWRRNFAFERRARVPR
jgi:hypothetical protein